MARKKAAKPSKPAAGDKAAKKSPAKPAADQTLSRATGVLPARLRDISKPIGVAEWQTQLVNSLPDPLRSNLPTIEQIEVELAAPSDRTKRGAT